MKGAVLALAVVATACTSGLTGSGHVVTMDIPVSSFDRLQASSAFDVRVSLGSTPRLTLHVDDNLLSRVEAGVSGGTLRIGLKPHFSVSRGTLEADVTTATLREIEQSGASRVLIREQLSAPSLAVTLSGASDIDASIQVQSATFRASGASRIRLLGNAKQVTVEGSGASSVELEGLDVTNADVDLSGASQGFVNVSGTLSVDLSGASILTYQGRPRITHQQISGGSALNPE